MDSALAAGINFFDTANVYGGSEPPRLDGGNPRPLVRPGRRAPRADGAGHQAVTAP